MRLTLTIPVVLALVAGLAQGAMAQDHGHDHAHGAEHAHGHGHEHGHEHGHKHGRAALDVDLGSALVTVTLTLPGGDFYGDLPEAERGPEAAAAIVTGPEILLPLPEAAGCKMVTSNIEIIEIAEGDHKGHADIVVRFGHACDNPAAIQTVKPAVFASFPDVETLGLTVTGADFELKAELGPQTGPVWVRPFAAPQS